MWLSFNCEFCNGQIWSNMVKLPLQAFKEVVIDESNPFIVNALRNRKHYEHCWCGSAKKYKKCHLRRKYEQPYELGQLLHLQREIFWRKRGCMHPLASAATCSGKVIDSHTIQRKGPLEKIVDETGHVMHFETTQERKGLAASKIGWRKASIFPGYCSGHDTSLFAPLETAVFSGDHSQCVLLAFRNICNELYRKQALVESLEFQRHLIDRGCDRDEQINRQFSYIENIEAQKKSKEEMTKLKCTFESAVKNGDLSKFESRVYYFSGELSVVSSSILHCEFDFFGNKLIDMWDLSKDAELLSHSTVNAGSGGAVVFVWLKEEKTPSKVVDSFNRIPNDEKGDIFVQYNFLNCENTFFSNGWWDNLSYKDQSLVQRYSNSLYYEGGKFNANKIRWVNWGFTNK